jgi:hypothetical protein
MSMKNREPALSGQSTISANAMPWDIERGLNAGFFRYLTKPIPVGEFMSVLDLALGTAAGGSNHVG